MSPLSLLLSVAVLVLGGASAYLWLELQQERDLRQVMQTRAADLEERLTLIDSKPDSHSRFDTRAPAAEPMSAPGLAASQPKRQASGHVERSTVAPWSQEERAIMQATARAAMRRKYPDLAAALHLGREEADSLFNLLAEQQLRFEENPPSAPEQELPWDWNGRPEWLRKMEEEEQQRRDKEIAELLGEARFRAWEDYAYSGEARRLAEALGAMLDGTPDSLHEDQEPSLVRALAEVQRRHGEPSTKLVTMVYIGDPKKRFQRTPTPAERAAQARQELEGLAERNQRMLQAAVPYLSTRQLARLDQMLDEQLDMARVTVAKLDAQAEPGAR